MEGDDKLERAHFLPRCIASTGKTFSISLAETHQQRDFISSSGYRQDGLESNCFRGAQLSADGSTVVTYSEDLIHRSFVLPPNLLEPSYSPHPLPTYSSSTRPISSTAFTLYPHYDLQYSSTTLALIGHNDLPVRLTNTLDFGYTSGTYPWENSYTEVFMGPHSLAFTTDGTHFVAGGMNAMAVFDLERSGEGPIEHHKTRKSVRARKMYGQTGIEISGLISTLAIEPSSRLLAAGTTNRQIALFAAEGSGENISSFDLSVEGEREDGLWGNGVNHMKWSGDGRYLFIAERQSDALLVYDIRVTGKRLGCAKGRRANTTHRLGFDLMDVPGQGVDVWAGGTDGMVRIWKDTTSKEGSIEPDIEFKASSDAVSSVLLHPTADVFATTSGQRLPPQDLMPDLDNDSDDSSDDSDSVSSKTMSENGQLDNALRVWSMTDLHPLNHDAPL